MKANNNVYCVCYNTLDVFTSKENAERFFTTCYYSSEGAERERYANILIDLRGGNVAIDGDDDYDDVDYNSIVNRVVYFDKNNQRIKEVKIDWLNYKKAIEKIEKEN